MNQALSSSSNSEEPGGMSDAEELRRMQMMGDIDGIGDTTFVDMTEEMKELGLG